MLAILGGVAGGVLLLLLLMLVCYRRRTSNTTRLAKLVANGDIDKYGSEASCETGQRSIKFGNMPSYRDEKRQRKRKMSARGNGHVVPTDLSRIDERSNEQDSVSNKSAGANSAVESYRSRTPETPKLPPPAAPDRGILKRAHQRGMLVDGALLVPHTGDAGYESEPPVYGVGANYR
jgi:hypothetical protein